MGDLLDNDNGDGSDDGGKGDVPLLANNELGVVAWLNLDKNGNGYLSVKIQLLDSTVNLFPTSDAVGRGLANLKAELDQQRERGGGR